jgi:hypothetical protein
MLAFRPPRPALPYGILIVPGSNEPDGTVLDPSNAANALAIATNVRSSFAAFEDDDRNGVEDHRG